jgi:FMN reductase (NADPH)
MSTTSVVNPIIDQINRHVSVRNYMPDPVSREWIEAIVGAGQRAATSSNLQVYAAIAVTDATTRKELAHWCGDQKHIEDAPVFIAWCADLSKLDRACQLRGLPHVSNYVENFLVSAVDVSLVMQNAAVAAESMGLGICYIGAIRNNPREIIRLLNMPRYMFPIAGMTLGFPERVGKQRPRLPLSAVLHWEKYSREGEDEALREYDQAMVTTGIYDNRQVPVPGKPDQMEHYGWTEHSARRVSQPIRVHLRAVLGEQGFDLQ